MKQVITYKEVLHTQGEFWFSISDDGIKVYEGETRLCQCDEDNTGAGNAAYLVDMLNNYQKLLDSNRELLEALKLAFASLKEIAPQAMKYGSLQPIIETAINNAKNLNK